MPGFAPLQRRPASEMHTAQARQAIPSGPIAQLAGALNARPAVAQLRTLSANLSPNEPVQRVFTIKGGKRYDDGDEVRKNTSLASHVRNQANSDKIIDAVAGMAEEGKDYGALSWLEVIDTAKKTLDDDQLMDFSHILEDTKYMADEKELKQLNRSNSMDFSDLLKTEFGGTSEEARTNTMRMEFSSEIKGHETQKYTTSGDGRLMSIGSSQLGDSRYAKFIPTLRNKVGKTEQITAQLLLHALTDHDKYLKLAKTEAIPDMGRLAIEQTLALLNNEIISRSSSNLVTIVGVLQSVANGQTASMIDGFNKVGMFVPTGSDHSYKIGGQMLSRLHHKGSKGREHLKAGRFDSKLTTLYENYRGGIHKLSRRHKTPLKRLQIPIRKLHRVYFKNLKKKTKVTGFGK
ncbi:MAG: hypothetical protein JSR60_19270 [Proteobacteria bacterium]|nr:hypothetical protein [Pseudomonadota bacterium]